jgi:maltose O-acetyltransferase
MTLAASEQNAPYAASGDFAMGRLFVDQRRRARVHSALTSIARQFYPRLRLANLLCGLLPGMESSVVRTHLYRFAGLDFHRSVAILGNIEFNGPAGSLCNVSIGQGSVIGNHVTINLDAAVTIGRNVSISPFVRIYTATHAIGPGSNRRFPTVLARPVDIGDGCWIGIGAMILPGVRIGPGSIVGAGAVVTQKVPPNTYVEGNPAMVVRELPWGNR